MMNTEEDVSMSQLLEDDSANDAQTILGEHLINMILAGEPIETVRGIIETGAPLWYQNVSEGMSPLHAAAYAQNSEIVRYLIDEGAIWNAVDNFKNTAGDIALSFNDEESYRIIRDAGIRAELLLGILSRKSVSPSAAIVLRSTDETAYGSTDAFLSSKLHFTTDAFGQDICMLNVEGEEIGVMMGWEKEIMAPTVQKLCENHPNADNLKVLNVGFGLGIIDRLFQSCLTCPLHHVIIEPHPDVLQHMRDSGWYEKPGVRILEGKWQDFVNSPQLLELGGFDIIYTDTFSEDYSTLRQFFECLPDLLSGPESRFSFFNGLGATHLMFYDVYTHISDMHLLDVGLDIQWSDVNIATDSQENRWGQSRQYFSLPTYRLPIGKMRAAG